MEKQEQRDGGGLVNAPLQLLIVSDTKMQFFRGPLLREMTLPSKFPDTDNLKAEKQVLVLSQAQDLLPQPDTFLRTGKSYQLSLQLTTSYGTCFVDFCRDSYISIIS